jgi:hypothetical protein
MVSEDARFGEWAIVELMGRRRVGGRVSSDQGSLAESTYLRVDVHGLTGPPVMTQFLPWPQAFYCLTITDEETARAVGAMSGGSAPVARWELERPAPRGTPTYGPPDGEVWVDGPEEVNVP